MSHVPGRLEQVPTISPWAGPLIAVDSVHPQELHVETQRERERESQCLSPWRLACFVSDPAPGEWDLAPSMPADLL